MKNNLAPIAIFTYKRVDFLKKLIHSLKKNLLCKNSVVYFFADKWNNSNDKEKVLEVRNFIKHIDGFKKKIIVFRDKNFGLSKNIISGINFVLKTNKKIIVLEDDLELSHNFLNYINSGLNIYKNTKTVASIHGWSFPINFHKNTPNYFFLRGADCWGWGTWKRAWEKFNSNGEELINIIQKNNLKKLFNLNNNYDYFKMLEDQIEKKNDSWAIRWHASTFLENMYTLYPKLSFVKNNGVKKGTHSNFDFLNFGKNFSDKKYQKIVKIPVKENEIVKKQLESFFKRNFFFCVKEFIKRLYK